MNNFKFAKNLKTAMYENKMTQTELAKKLGTTQQTVSRWLQGINEPDLNTLTLICIYLNETPNDLLGLGYVKEVIENDYPITLHCIKRSNDYHDTTLTKIASATALRKALKEKQDVHDYLLDMSYYDLLYHQNDFFDYLKKTANRNYDNNR